MNRMSYTKAILIFVSGIISVAASLFLVTEGEGYGFLIGYGYTALAGGLAGILYSYFKKQNLREQRKI